MKPVLQALVLADRVYCDKSSGKKIIAGTFNRLFLVRSERLIQECDAPGGERRQAVPGGMHAGSPWAYISLTDVVGDTQLTLQFVNLTKNQVLFETALSVSCNDRLQTIELPVALPPLPVSEKGVYAFEVVCEGDILGSHRIVAEELPGIER